MTPAPGPPPGPAAPPPPVWRVVAGLAGPALAQQGLLFALQLFDRFLTGRFATSQQAALTTANYIYWFTTAYAVVVNAGATAVVGRFVGARDFAGAGRAAGQALVLAAGFGAAAGAAGVVFAPTLVRALNLSDEAAAAAAAYLRPLAVCLPFAMVEAGGIACLIGAGDTRTGLKVLAAVVAVNAPLAWGLSGGFGPAADFGFVGIAWGTALSHVGGCGLVVATLARGRYGLRVTARDLWPDFGLVGRLLRVSVPAAVDSMSIGLFQFVFLGMVNRLGDVAASAHGIAIQLEGLGYLSGVAFGTAAASLTGRALGAGRPGLAARGGWTALALGAGVMSVMGGVFAAFARPMFGAFCRAPDQADVIEAGVPVLRLVACAMPALAATIVLTQALRGAGDTRVPVVFTWVGFLGVRLPAAYVLTHPAVGLGLFGAWLAMVADIYVRGAFFLARFAGGKWKATKV